MKNKTEIGTICVDGYNMSSVIQKISNIGTAGTYRQICNCTGINWREDAKKIAELLEKDRLESTKYKNIEL